MLAVVIGNLDCAAFTRPAPLWHAHSGPVQRLELGNNQRSFLEQTKCTSACFHTGAF